MSRGKYLLTLALVGGVSLIFGMMLASGPLRPAGAPEPAVWSPAIAAPPAPVAGLEASPLAGAPVSFADVAERANLAVVSIASVEFKKVRNPHGNGVDPFGDPFQFFFGPGGPQGQRPDGPGGEDEEDQGEGDAWGRDEQRLESGGSGFIISDDGHILTNNHVVEKATRLEVTLEGGAKYEAKVIGTDPMIDLALIKIDAPDKLPTVPMGDSDALRVGEWVVAIGNPLIYEHTVTVGVVSGKGRRLNDPDNANLLANFIQTDAAINFGNSGGPLLNTRGEVVGINTAITRSSGPYSQGMIQGIGFALPINQARAVIDQLRDNGKVARGYLGIGIGPVDEAKKVVFELPDTSGALVNSVQKGLPGAEAGLREGDVITHVDGKKVKDTSDLISTVSSHRPGETVTLGIIRDGRATSLKVRLGDRAKETTERVRSGSSEEEGGAQSEDDSAANDVAAKLGIKAKDIDGAMAKQLKLPADAAKGVVVESVRPSSNAYDANLRRGWIITRVNNTPVSTMKEFRAAIAKLSAGDYVKLYTVAYGSDGQVGQFVVFQVDGK